jgi:type VI secretion system lysozyme-like protein
VTKAHRLDPGGTAPLFERLIDTEPRQGGEAFPYRLHTVADMVRSIGRGIARLIDTRRPVDIHDVPREEALTVREYGLPDIARLSPRSHDDRQLLARTLVRVISAYEPRLHDVAVTVEPVPAELDRVRARVTAQILIDRVMQPVSFALLLGPGPTEAVAP